jgi:hypothetical protein
MYESDESAFVLSSTGSLDGSGRERLPDNGFANVGGNEKGDTRSETISCTSQWVKLTFTVPFCKSSSQTITKTPANKSWTTRRNALPAPRSAQSPYIPLKT